MSLWGRRSLQASAIGVGVVLLVLMIQLVAPLVTPAAVEDSKQGKAKVPAYSYEPWYTLAVQDGRTKPFQTACVETVRQITGRSRFEGLDPVAVVLAWMLSEGDGGKRDGTDWETYPFILCDHHGLRRKIHEHLLGPDQQLTDAQETSKYISPADLRRSPGFDRLLGAMARERKEMKGRAHLELTTEYLKAEEVGRRLLLFDALCGKSATRLFRNALIGDTFLDLHEYTEIMDISPEAALINLARKQTKLPDPFHLVGLDRVPGSGWFSLGELRAVRGNPDRWQSLLARRLREMPQRYLGPDAREALGKFQERINAGKDRECLEEVEATLRKRREVKLRQFEEADRAGDHIQANSLFHKLLPSLPDQRRFHEAQARLPKQAASLSPALISELRTLAGQADEAVLQRFAKGLESTRRNAFQDAEFRMVQLDYLESMFPELYREASIAQPLPQSEVDAVLKAWECVRAAYQSGKADEFDDASGAFLQMLAATTDGNTIRGLAERLNHQDVQSAFTKLTQARQAGSDEQVRQARDDFFKASAEAGEAEQPYPGVSTFPMEILFNRWQPFLWSWVTMLGALSLLGISLGFGGRLSYRVGLIVYVSSLVIQTMGFSLRIAISGRAPVSNMYETIIFAAYMAAIFALILEWIYRQEFIALAGAAVATLGLVLADHLPLALDPKISPMVPVLRTNFWLTIHVLTIVSSYAAGTLAWGLGNLTLGLLVFRKGNPETLKTLAQYTYRALQIAVLLLASGTFLGGCWAAESWGRFWGWDPKEVGALIALVCYVIPLHARYLGWVHDFGLALAAVLCYASILLSWYVVNFLVAAGLHSYGFSAGGGGWVLWASLLNIEWILIAALSYCPTPVVIDTK